MVAATVTLRGYSSGSHRVLSACFLCGLCTLPTPQGSQNTAFDFAMPQLPVVVGGGSPLQVLLPCPRPLLSSISSCPVFALLVGKVQVTDPEHGAGGFCFNVDKAQDNFHRVGNLVWEKKLFINRKRSDLKQKPKNCTSLALTPIFPLLAIIGKVRPEDKGISSPAGLSPVLAPKVPQPAAPGFWLMLGPSAQHDTVEPHTSFPPGELPLSKRWELQRSVCAPGNVLAAFPVLQA